MNTIFALLVIYQIKHYIADFPLQNSYMLGKFKYEGWALPLLAHVAVHGLFTFIISFGYIVFKYQNRDVEFMYPGILILCIIPALFDMTIHFIMDRIKASPNLLGRFKALSANEMNTLLSYIPTLGKEGVMKNFSDKFRSNTLFWHSLGIDQGVHHLTHYAIIYFLVRYM